MTSWARSFIVVVAFVAGCAGSQAGREDATPARADGGEVAADGATSPTIVDAAHAADAAMQPDAGMAITNVAVDVSADNQVRQGAGPITLTVMGAGLASVSAAMIGTMSATVMTATDAKLTLSASIPHGCALGALTVSLTSASGTVTSSDVVNITAISAAAGVGDDGALGTPDSPFATLTRALGVAGSGDTIKLADGTYNATAEKWPELLSSTPNVPDGVTLEGSSLAGTILAPAPTAEPDVDGLWFAGSAQVSNLQVHGFAHGVVANSAGNVSLSNMHVFGNTVNGVLATSTASLLIGSVEIDTSGGAGIFLGNSASAALDDVNVHDNTTGAYLGNSSQLSALLGTKFTNNGHAMGANHSGVFITGAASASLVATVTGNVTAGVYSESTGLLSLEGTYSANGTSPACGANPLCSGIVLYGGQTVQLQGQASNNAVYGVVSRAMHPVITMTGMTLSGNKLANASFTDETTPIASYTQVTINGTTLSNSITGITWGDGVMLSMTGGSISADTNVDIANQSTVGSLGSSFNDVKFGAAATIFPVDFWSVTETTASGSVPNGPSWSILTPSAPNAGITFATTVPPPHVSR